MSFEFGNLIVNSSKINYNILNGDNGGGLYLKPNTLEFTNCEVLGHQASQKGGGLYYSNGSNGNAIFNNILIANNSLNNANSEVLKVAVVPVCSVPTM